MKGYCKCGVQFDENNSNPFVLKRGFGGCRECLSAYMRLYNAANKEKIAKKNKENYFKNAPRYRAYRRAYYVRHKEERLAWYKQHIRTVRGRYTQVRELLKKERTPSSDSLWSLNYYAELIKDSQCHYCLGPLSPTGHALDRVDNSQSHVCHNVVSCCWWCNERKKADLSYEEMMLLAPALREIRKRREAVNVATSVSGLSSDT